MEYANMSGIKSPFSPRVKQSISGRRSMISSAKKNNQNSFIQESPVTGEIIYKTPQITIETYGLPLPVIVTEALAFASGEVTVRMSSCGWCWLVIGRKLLVWPWDPSIQATSARELTLPQTDLAHKADLVVLFYEDVGQVMPSCMGVSPEGTVRYWSCVGQAGAYVDVNAELAGQECDRLLEPTRAGLLLATTTCTLVLLKHQNVDGRATVSCHTLRPPSGWLGGLGRRVSLLFFGTMPSQQDTKLVGVVVVKEGPILDSSEGKGGLVALVGGGVLQLWAKDLHEHPLSKLLPAHHPPSPGGSDVNALELSALDVRASNTGGLLVLLATRDMRTALAHINVDDPANPRVTSLTPVRTWRRDDLERPPRFLPLGNSILLYTAHYIALINTTSPAEPPEAVEFSTSGDRLLGCTLCGGSPLLFTGKHGLSCLLLPSRVAQHNAGSRASSPAIADLCTGNLSLLEIDPREITTLTTDACGKLKTAFLFHLRRDDASCISLLQEVFPPPPPQSTLDDSDVDAVLDRTVVKIATEMLDDMPAGDPRWQQRRSSLHSDVPLGSSCALQLGAQLRDKKRAFSLFIEFLRTTGLWQRLAHISKERGGGAIATRVVLGRLAENVCAAIALYETNHEVVHMAVKQVVSDWCEEEEPSVIAGLESGALSASDVCYRRASRALQVLRAVASLHSQAVNATGVISAVLSEVHKCRASWFTPLGPSSLRFLNACVELMGKVVGIVKDLSGPERAQALSNMSRLAELVLADMSASHNDDVNKHVYGKLTTSTIKNLVETGQKDRALTLAEKHRDFRLLIELCVENNDMDRLYDIIDKYANEGVAESTFAYLTDRGGKHVVSLLRELGSRVPVRLAAWSRARAANKLLALHYMGDRKHFYAAAAFCDEAEQERESVDRMMTAASLGKLCLLVDKQVADPELLRRVESRLILGEQIQALPQEIKMHNAVDRVVEPDELVQMYIDCDNNLMTEFEYKKALDLTELVQDMEKRDDLRLRIWCACIKRDSWSEAAGEAHEQLQSKMFFRLIDLEHLMGGDLDLLLPPMEDILTAPELAELASNPQFHYLLKYGYQCLHDVNSRSE